MGLYRDELYHHGILGQKWGRKNGPPYPLKASAHSASEKKAADNEAKIAKGKKIARNVLIGVGAIAVGAIAFNVLSASGSGDKWVEISKKYGNLKSRGKKPLKKTRETWLVEHEVATHIHGREENGMKLIDQPIIQWPMNEYLYEVRNNFDGTYDVLSKKRLPDTHLGLFERDND